MACIVLFPVTGSQQQDLANGDIFNLAKVEDVFVLNIPANGDPDAGHVKVFIGIDLHRVNRLNRLFQKAHPQEAQCGDKIGRTKKFSILFEYRG